MSDTTPFGFGKFVPGFDFLQNLAKGASGSIPQMPNLSNWIAPTISVEELDKRVQELKAVQFWLEQNSRALSATIQALEVQKMTLATLQGMNFSMGDVANAFKLKTADSVMGGVQKISDSLASAAHSMVAAVHPTDTSAPPQTAAAPAAAAQPEAPAPQSGAAKPSAIDPMQWWGALSQQFQHIAGNVMADVAKQASFDAAKGAASTLAKDAFKTATDMASQMASKGVQSVQEATRAATHLASAAAPAPLAKKKTTVAKKTTAAKSTSPAASAAPARPAAVKKSATKTPAPATQKTSARRAPSKTAR